MICPHCGHSVPDSDRFCSNCGSALRRRQDSLAPTAIQGVPTTGSNRQPPPRYSPAQYPGKPR